MTALLCLAIGLAAVVAWWWRYSWLVTPDGNAYLVIAAGHGGPTPFRLRALVHALRPLCRNVSPNPPQWADSAIEAPVACRWWRRAALAALVGCTALVGIYAEQRGFPGWAAAGLFVTLPWFRSLCRNPCMLDQFAMLGALGAAVAGQWWLVVLCSLFAGAASEKAPIFAAVFAWSWLPLVGLVVPLVMAMVTTHRELAWTAGHNDWRAMRLLHNRDKPHIYLLPWGACLLAVLAPTWQLALAVGGGYALWINATDRSRLIQWGNPVVILATLTAIPPQWWGAAILAQVVAPWCDFEKPWK